MKFIITFITISICVSLIVSTDNSDYDSNDYDSDYSNDTSEFNSVDDMISKEDCKDNEHAYWDKDREECVCRKKNLIVACVLQFFFGFVGAGCWYAGFYTPATISVVLFGIALIAGCLGICCHQGFYGLSGALTFVDVVYGFIWLIILAINKNPSPEFNCNIY